MYLLDYFVFATNDSLFLHQCPSVLIIITIIHCAFHLNLCYSFLSGKKDLFITLASLYQNCYTLFLVKKKHMFIAKKKKNQNLEKNMKKFSCSSPTEMTLNVGECAF